MIKYQKIKSHKATESYKKNGFYIFKNIIEDKHVAKINNFVEKKYLSLNKNNIKKLPYYKIISNFEEKKRYDELYKIFIDIKKSNHFKKISKSLVKLSKNIFNVNCSYLNSGMAIGLNSSKRTAYDWHQEKSYYKDIETIHFQFPILGINTKKNGTMSVLSGSHKIGVVKDFIKVKKKKKSVNTLLPKNINSLKKNFFVKFINLNKNDLAVFHQNLIHKSNTNITSKVRLAGIIRLRIIN
jgi:ectoine hydroxylase-related dioxygenase (phytanoyl-CoA dioxygenase family)